MRIFVLSAFLCLLLSNCPKAQNTTPYWSLNGNSNASATSSKLGTTNAIPLRLFTNNLERLLINSNGSVGIGTTSPLTKLHVNGFGSFGNRVTAANGTRSLNLADDNAVMRVLRVHPSNAPAVELISRTSADGANVAYWDFYAQPTDKSFRIRDRVGGGSGLDRLTISNNGNVGIGTINPVSKLHVIGIQTLDGNLNFTSGSQSIRFANPGSTSNPMIYMYSSGFFNRSRMVIAHSAGAPAYGLRYTDSSDRFDFVGNGESRMSIGLNNGNIGIGTTTPTEKLHVEGKGLFIGGLNLISDIGPALSINSYGDGIDIKARSGTAIYAIGETVGIDVTTTQEFGAIGINSLSSETGVYAEGHTPDGPGIGIHGKGGTGVYGYTDGWSYTTTVDNTRSSGVYGYNTTIGPGVRGVSVGPGVYGQSTNSYGVYGTTSNTSSYAGYFNGKVNATGGYFSASDSKLKQNISDLTGAIDLIGKLQPKAYEYKQDGSYQKMNLPKGKHFGLIAQDVEVVVPELVNATRFDTRMMNIPEVPKPGTSEAVQSTKQQNSEEIDFKVINYMELIPIMVKAIQEQQQQIEQQEQQIEQLKHEISNLKNERGSSFTDAKLSQVAPNPVKGSALVQYSVPEGSLRPRLLLTDGTGRNIRQFNLGRSGSIIIDVSTLATGVYFYSLIVDNKTLLTRKMTVIR